MSIQKAKSTYVVNEPDNTDVLANHSYKARKNMGIDLFLQPVFFTSPIAKSCLQRYKLPVYGPLQVDYDTMSKY